VTLGGGGEFSADSTGCSGEGAGGALGCVFGFGLGFRAGGAAALDAARRFTATGAAFAGAAFEGVARRGDGFPVLGLAALVPVFAPAPDFGGGAGFGAGDCRAACAALSFFLTCLATLLPALASFRARLSTALARRTCFLAVSARAAACAASDWSRCAAAASFARFVEADVATVRSRLKN